MLTAKELFEIYFNRVTSETSGETRNTLASLAAGLPSIDKDQLRLEYYERLLDDLLKDFSEYFEQNKINKKIAEFEYSLYQQQEEALAAGRLKGVEKRQEIAKEKNDVLMKAIASLFDKPEKPGWGWSNPEIFQFLKKANYGYKDNTLLQKVKLEAARYRKARKEQQASKYLTGN